ncbi:MAG TPA: aminopeptidase P family protein [Bacteroidia bacterium]|nr:aminopeptidase P family protein [Bacteroidia bacterium]HRS59307.1 aminopeptidase P family protein [Bacteroidia bacterium]HRU68247.1 aminopeptidase P family protein [Bacteroidia bacterium]
MFEAKVYINRRNRLRKNVEKGIILILGNEESPMNYPANGYHFRQDSNFLYFFGLDHPGYAGVIDLDEGKDYIFGNDVDIDDIIWMGYQPGVSEQALKVGIEHTDNLAGLEKLIKKAVYEGRKIHYTPPYRTDNILKLEDLLGIHHSQIRKNFSLELVKAIVNLRSVKEDVEIAEIEKALDTAYNMHTTAIKMCNAGVMEREIAGRIEGIALSAGGPVSFPVILTINGQTLHNHYHGNILQEGRMVVIDAGCETELHYASDITRTVPVNSQFNQRQKEIYQAVLDAQMTAIRHVKPGIYNKELHLIASRSLAQSLKSIGLMKGDVDEAVAQGAHALFFPHGLGHMMGLDVHDMEDLGQIYVGYDETIQPATQFGLAFLRLARELKPGFVFTIEPGCYFIPALIDQWKAENKFSEFLNYQLIETYKDFGGIRIEDDILVTEDGYRVLGKPIPKTIEEIENL